MEKNHACFLHKRCQPMVQVGNWVDCNKPPVASREQSWLILGYLGTCSEDHLLNANFAPKPMNTPPHILFNTLENLSLVRSFSVKYEEANVSNKHQIVPVQTNVNPRIMNP